LCGRLQISRLLFRLSVILHIHLRENNLNRSVSNSKIPNCVKRKYRKGYVEK